MSLLWNGGAYTECQGNLMEFPTDFGFTATEIRDPQKLCRKAEQLDLAPYRLKKDVRVNTVLQGMGLAPWPEDGCLLFAGGTGLAKAWRLSPRFSEDIDFWHLGRAFPPDISADTQQRVHAHLLHCLQQWVLPRIPESSINGPLSQFRESVANRRKPPVRSCPGDSACRIGVQEQGAKYTRPRQGTSLETSLRIPPGCRGNPTLRGILAQPADRDLVGHCQRSWQHCNEKSCSWLQRSDSTPGVLSWPPFRPGPRLTCDDLLSTHASPQACPDRFRPTMAGSSRRMTLTQQREAENGCG